MKRIGIILGICLLTAVSCRQADEQKEVTMENAVIENIMARRSIRKYKAEPVDRETMAKILECGINAPSGMNRQSWEVRVVDNPELLNEMKEAMAAVIAYLFKAENLECLCCRAFAANTASRALLRSLGFQENGIIPRCVKGYTGEIFDDVIHTLFREDFHKE